METYNLICNLLIVRRIITSLEYIKRVFWAYNGNDNRKLVKAKNVMEFKKTIPFETAGIYISPDNSDEMIKYAVQSVDNFSFFGKVEGKLR